MNLQTQIVNLRKLIADEGKVITDKKTRMLRTKELYLGVNETTDNFIEIDENTPLPEAE